MVSQEDEEREKKHLESLISMRVDGIMISIAQNTKDYTIFETIKKRNIPLVFFDRIINGMGFSTVSVNDRCGSFDLINYAIRAGYLKIAHLSGPLNINIGYERLKGYEEALKYNGIQINKKWIIECGFSEKNGYDGFMKLFNLGELPELIYAVTFPVALGILNAAKDVKVKIPEEINVVCFGRTDFNHVVTPKISCVVQPTRDLGIKSIELLLSEIEHPTVTDRKKIILDTELEIYDTFIPPKADKKVV
jgi:LacI family transcriptional regulator